ncbi:F-box protein [Acorus calamus]|uniref:F-box protein n=1 Tax=Acorus calamus TaxID=4465 RepID=A0AAV9D746_ACOCL|nr:F-box protein [Acorus calamus]
MKLEDYFQYADSTKEERWLYLFDPSFTEKVPALGTDYKVPEYFREDLFAILGPERPDHKWVIVGPQGSGSSSFHVVPNQCLRGTR